MMQKIIGVLQSFTAPTRLDILFFDKLVTLETQGDWLAATEYPYAATTDPSRSSRPSLRTSHSIGRHFP